MAEHGSSSSCDNSHIDSRTISPSKEPESSESRIRPRVRGSGEAHELWVTAPDLVTLHCAAEPVSISRVFGRNAHGKDGIGEGGGLMHVLNLVRADESFDKVARFSLSIVMFVIVTSWLVSVGVPVYVLYIAQIPTEGFHIDCKVSGVDSTMLNIQKRTFDKIELKAGIIFGAAALVVSLGHAIPPVFERNTFLLFSFFLSKS